MPVSKNPIDLTRVARKGRDLDKTVSEQALDFDITKLAGAGLTAHILDPVDAHDASAISVDDPGGHYVSLEVEGALGEVGETLLSKGSQGVLEDCEITDVGLTVTLGGASRVFINGMSVDVSSQNVAVDNNQTRYLYVDVSDNTLKQSASTGSFSSGDVVLWEVTTSAGAVSSTRDLRYFVFGADRKSTPTAVDASTTPDYNDRSEGNFMSIQAALNYLDVFGGTEDTRYEIVVRGTHTTTGITIPVDRVTLRGEGRTAVVQTGANGTTLFSLGGHVGITFKDLTLHCDNHSGCVGISDTVSTSNGLTLDGCMFTKDTQPFSSGVSLTQSGSATKDLRAFNCIFEDVEDYGILVRRPDRVIIRGCTMTTTVGTGTGVSLGLASDAAQVGEGESAVVQLRSTGFAVGVYLKAENCQVSDCVLDGLGGTHGVNIDTGATGCRVLNSTIRDVDDGVETASTSHNALVMGCLLEDTLRGVYFQGNNSTVETCSVSGRVVDGTVGVRVDGTNCRVSGTTLTCNKTAWTTEDPTGIEIRQKGARITGCSFDSWYNTSGSPKGSAIRLNTSSSDTVIHGSKFTGSYRDIEVSTGVSLEKIVITDCQFNETYSHSIYAVTCKKFQVSGCNFVSGVAETASSYIYLDEMTNVTVDGNVMECKNRGSGITIAGTDSAGTRTVGVSIVGNQIRHCGDFGISLVQYVRNVTITGNTLDGWLDVGDDVKGIAVKLSHSSGTGIRNVAITGNTISRWVMGVVCEGIPGADLENVTITGNVISNIADASTPTEDWSTQGSLGIAMVYCANSVVSGNTLYSMGELVNDDGSVYQPAGADVSAYGMYIDNCLRVNVSGNNLRHIVSKGTGKSDAIRLVYLNDSSGSVVRGWHSVKNNIVSDVDDNGISVSVSPGTTTANTLTLKQVNVSGNTIHNIRMAGVSVTVGGTVTNPATLQSFVCSDNQIEDCAAHSIVVSSTQYSTVDTLTVNGNQITDESGLNNNGILLVSNSANGVGYHDIQLNGNNLFGDGSTAAAIKLSTHTVDVDNVQVMGNQCNDWGTFLETYIGTDSGATAATLTRISVVGNTIKNVDSKGIWLRARGEITHANVSSNVGAAKSVSLSDWVQVATSTVSQTLISDNTFEDSGGYFVRYLVDSVYHVTVADNIFRTDVGTTTQGVYFDIAGGSSPQARMVNVTGNTMYLLPGSGVYIEDTDAGGGKMHGISITGNTFNLCAYAVSTDSTVRISCNDITAQGFRISDNTFEQCNHTSTTVAVVRVDSTAVNQTFHEAEISRNMFTNCYGDGISIEIDDPNVSGFESISIDGNHINTDGTGILIGSFGTTTGDARHISVSNNRIWNCTAGGIELDFSPVADLFSLSVSGNTVRSCTGGSGISVLLAKQSGSENRHLQFVGNTCYSNASHGIVVQGDKFSTAYNFRILGLVISANECSENTQSGLAVLHTPNSASSTSEARGLQITGNVLYGNLEYGMYLRLRGSIEGLNVSNNSMDSNTDGWRIYTGVLNTLDGGAAAPFGAPVGTINGAVTVIGNTARDNASKDVSSGGTNWDGSTTPAAAVCMGNIDSSSGTDQWVDHFPATTQLQGTISIT